MPLAGGIVQHGYQCGMLWGAALAAGAQAYRLFGPGPQAEAAAVIAAQRLVHSFRAHYNLIDCFELTGTDWRIPKQALWYMLRGGAIRCVAMTAGFASIARREIDAAFDNLRLTPPPPPVSCAALLAQKMAVSDMHVIMAAGLAGGIGLSGNACGALGAAIWIKEMASGKNDIKTIGFKSPRATQLIDRFMEGTDAKFECSDIVGRKFWDVSDHARYLREGGCSQIIEVLAS
jgi:hypothetical protein